MGRKKGKQRGEYKSKSLRIAANNLQSQEIQEDISYYKKHQYASSSSSFVSSIKFSNDRQSVFQRDIAQMVIRNVMTTQESREMRLRRMCESVAPTKKSIKKEIIARHSIGWVIFYNVTSSPSSSPSSALESHFLPPSLLQLSIQAFASALPLYMEQLEHSELKSIFKSFDPMTLARLSALVKVNDELIPYFAQSDVHSLVLNGVTDSAIELISPSLLDSHCENWEEVIDVEVKGCLNLQRLEILNSQVSAQSLANLFRCSPGITHLSLSKSVCEVECLPCKLIVLDLSHTSWLYDSILYDFVKGQACLEVLSVAGCPFVSEKCVKNLNQLYFNGKEVITYKIFQKDIWN